MKIMRLPKECQKRVITAPIPKISQKSRKRNDIFRPFISVENENN
jgi:hypothetical protein